MERIKKKNIFITGGLGFIGRNLQEYFHSKYTVFAPSHAELDLLDTKKVEHFIQKKNIQIIIHGANIGGGRDTLDAKEVVQKNLTMFFNIVRNLNIIEKIIHLGSGAEYDKKRPLVKVKEEDFDLQIPQDDYGFYKYVCSKYIERTDKIISLRLFAVYGKYENYLFKFISNAVVKNLFHLPIVIGQNVYFDYLYINDLLQIIDYFLAHDGKYKAYNISNGEKIDLLTISKTINKISDFKSKISILHKGLNHEYTANNQRLVKEIRELKFTSSEEGIKILYDWYKSKLKTIDKKVIEEDRCIKYINVEK